MEEHKERALKVYHAIFNCQETVEIDGLDYNIGSTSRTKLRGCTIEGLFYIEQNPKKASEWAKKAREGHKIMWVLKGRRYLARVMDGDYLDLKRSSK